MQKEKTYRRSRFGANVLSRADATLTNISGQKAADLRRGLLTVEHDDATWRYDSLEEFLADYRRFQGAADYFAKVGSLELRVWVQSTYTSVTVTAPSRAEIEQLFAGRFQIRSATVD